MDKQTTIRINDAAANLNIAEIAALAGVSAADALAFITGDWDNMDDHIEWLQTASSKEIASWIAAGQ